MSDNLSKYLTNSNSVLNTQPHQSLAGPADFQRGGVRQSVAQLAARFVDGFMHVGMERVQRFLLICVVFAEVVVLALNAANAVAELQSMANLE